MFNTNAMHTLSKTFSLTGGNLGNIDQVYNDIHTIIEGLQEKEGKILSKKDINGNTSIENYPFGSYHDDGTIREIYSDIQCVYEIHNFISILQYLIKIKEQNSYLKSIDTSIILKVLAYVQYDYDKESLESKQYPELIAESSIFTFVSDKLKECKYKKQCDLFSIKNDRSGTISITFNTTDNTTNNTIDEGFNLETFKQTVNKKNDKILEEFDTLQEKQTVITK